MSRYTYIAEDLEICYGCHPTLGYFIGIFEREPEPSAFGFAIEPALSLCARTGDLTGKELAELLREYHCENHEHIAQAFFDRQF